MKYLITGSLGHISKPLAEKLIQSGHEITVISNHPGRKEEIERMEAHAAIGSVEDLDFLKAEFKKADIVYTMVPPTHQVKHWQGYIHTIGKNYSEAIKNAGIKKVVNLSSIGAHMEHGCGPVSGLFQVEKELNSLAGVDIVHLRPAYFFTNFMNNIGMVKHMGIIGANFGEAPLLMVHPKDIAAKAAEFLLNPSFEGKTIHYIIGDERKLQDIAHVLGNAVDKPNLPWVNFSNEDSLNGMIQSGMTEEFAKNYVEMGTAIASGEMSAHFNSHRNSFAPTKLEEFAPEFALAYAQA